MRFITSISALLTAALLAMPFGNAVAKVEKPAKAKPAAEISSPAPQTDKESRKSEDERLAKEAEAERLRQEQAEKAEAERIARLEREKEAERQRVERERLCVIKPVMTDTEIAQCKEVWR